MNVFSCDKYLGRQFSLDAYNCWDFVREVWKDLRSQDLLEVLDWSRFSIQQAQGEFTLLQSPVDPCIVLLQGVSALPHVGVFYSGYVLHLRPTGALYESLELARIGFHTVRFYKTR